MQMTLKHHLDNIMVLAASAADAVDLGNGPELVDLMTAIAAEQSKAETMLDSGLRAPGKLAEVFS